MEEVLLVDGYNVLFAWPQLAKLAAQNIEDARNKLLDILQNYQGYAGNQVIVVFDGHRVKGGLGGREKQGRLLVIYTGEGETADSVIERLTAQYVRQSRVYVVTSDWDSQKVVFGLGAYRIPSRELWDMVVKQRQELDLQMSRKPSQRKELAQFLDEETRQELEEFRRRR
ncbi:MAG TPA: NYN domain-containing protein [Bacillota bacterium]|nr:NYN domain-containing protein [Bacillota bacterium]